ncbi:MAG: hypothetical protein DWH70_00275 [Planctomycetota bacterium]|nr:MAG: hypothetical protein DWH70_00275 [Planctomycetota bacterium]
MFKQYMILVVLFFLVVNNQASSIQISQPSISEMIKALGDSSFEVREKAEKDLGLAGEPALDQLRKERKSEDPEIRRRVESLIKKIELESDNKKLINPKKITMKHSDVPVTEVIADLVKQSGYRIILEDKSRALESKKISVEMKDVAFWEALETIAMKANLVEVAGIQGAAGNPIRVEFPKQNVFPRVAPKLVPPPVPPKEVEEPKKGVKNDVGPQAIRVLFVPQEKAQPVAPPAVLPQPLLPPGIGQVFGQIAIGMDQVPAARGKENVIILKEGKFDLLPTDNRSAYRIRLLKNPETVFGKPDDKHILIGLEVTPEPRFKLQEITGVKITKAVDESGQVLEQDTTISRNDIPAPPVPGRIIARPIQAIGLEGKAGAVDSKVPIHFLKAQKESMSIQMLEGKLILQVLDDSTPILEITNIEKEVGKKIEGKSGAWLKINECGKDAKGFHTLRIEYDIPADAVAANGQNNRIQFGNIGIQNNIIIQNGQFNMVGGVGPANLGGFKILDAEGKTLTPNSSSTSVQVGPGGTKRSINVTYPASSKAPSKIIYEGGTPIAVEVPFSLKLIPLQ